MSHAGKQETLRKLAVRWLKFHAVGAIGFAVQIAALALYKGVFGIHYLWATAMAVETAVLHNFVWHEHWTWREHTRNQASWRALAGRLFRFHLSNGFVSILSNLVLMKILVGFAGIHYLIANPIAIAITSLANFLLSEFFVFRKPTT
ncbi:MAG: GtrA family protein [bacterium]|nr:GtrA family protein [bacterium]